MTAVGLRLQSGSVLDRFSTVMLLSEVADFRPVPCSRHLRSDREFSAANRRDPRVRVTLVVTVLGSLTATTFVQVRWWRNSAYLWTRAVRVTERNPVSHCQLANAFMEAGLSDRATALYREGLEQWPEDYYLNLNLGMYFIRHGEGEKALPHLRKSVEIDPEIASTKHLLGRALWKTGALVEAEEVLHQAIADDPGLCDPITVSDEFGWRRGGRKPRKTSLNRPSAWIRPTLRPASS